MIKTSTLISSLQTPPALQIKKEDIQLPEFAEPSEASVNNILNYSKSLKVYKSELVNHIEVVNS